MEKRIYQILKTKKLTASQFADAIGVQRSSISHLMAGRNKPSMDVIEKILTTYPDLNPDYLLLGKGNVLREADLFTSRDEVLPDEMGKEKEWIDPANSTKHDKQLPLDDLMVKGHAKAKPTGSFREIERIVLFFRDGTFKEYRQDG